MNCIICFEDHDGECGNVCEPCGIEISNRLIFYDGRKSEREIIREMQAEESF